MSKFEVDSSILNSLPTPNFTADINIGDVLPEEGRSAKDHEYATYARLSKLLEEFERRQQTSGVGKWFVPGTPFGIEHCHKHRAFFAAGAEYGQRLFMAANRVGKTVSGALESTYHATGEYPEWWTGKRFDGPTRGWAMGSTARSTRDTVQKELLGGLGAWGTGMIPADKIVGSWALAGVPQGIDMIRVKHISGGESTIGFKNYEQPIEAFYGTDLHWVWPDEIVPINIYNECLVRTMTTGGIIYVTFTPLKGLTPLVVKFCEDADYLAGAKRIIGIPQPEGEEEELQLGDNKSYKAIIQAGWNDAPWLDEGEKNKILDASEPHLRETRSTGVPSMGSGNVYPLTLESMMVDPFMIPNHFKKLYALDVGWNRTAALWGALDPNTDTLYLYDEHYIAEQPPAVHAHAVRSRGEWIPGVIDPASKGKSQGDGTQLFATYRNQGLKITEADNAVEPGIQEVWQRMAAGKLKFFSTLHSTAKEYVLYRRDDKGRIVKEKDHLMDCLRYLVVSLRKAKSIDQIVKAPVYAGPNKYKI
jgi:phage terminase large subunit-like protein